MNNEETDDKSSTINNIVKQLYDFLYDSVTHHLFRSLMVLCLIVVFVRRKEIRELCKGFKNKK